MADLEDKKTWKTRKEMLINLLMNEGAVIDLKTSLREMEYSNKKTLIHDIKSIAMTLKNKGVTLTIYPPRCIACGFIFQQTIKSLKIPSKCPKCREERIEWPSITIKKRK